MSDLEKIQKELEIEDETTLTVVNQLLEHFKQFYKKEAVEIFFEKDAQINSMMPMAPVNPIDCTLAYAGDEHICYVSVFLGPKIGYELSFRINKKEASQEFVNLLANLANRHLCDEYNFLQNKYTLLEFSDWFESNIYGLLFVQDPIFGTKQLDIGNITFVHVMGIEKDIFMSLTAGTGDEGKLDELKIESFLKEELTENPYLVTIEMPK
ncbi:hypothetical protein [Spirochaeta cellobiosiphila]|uniref:hypothetical protein n=1 Tax=Spirochaeta cellobiosiphila TaxID=504483 RepID=UPI00040D855D|nr:hypothetical protein [Spirochaeta cellobiosiphila]